MTARLREALDKKAGKGKTKSNADLLIEVLLRVALDGDRQAIKDIFERVDGKVAEMLPPTGDMKAVNARRNGYKPPDAD